MTYEMENGYGILRLKKETSGIWSLILTEEHRLRVFGNRGTEDNILT
jgi:hypothetical protein